MPLVGGGGAGNIAGSNPTGTSKGLNYIGDHCYAYSGLIQINTSLTNCLDFTTGASYALVDLTLCGAAKHDGGTNTGANTVFEIYMDGTRNLLVKVESIQEDMPATQVIPILIAPFTRVQVSFRCDASTADMFNSVTLAGRVYA